MVELNFTIQEKFEQRTFLKGLVRSLPGRLFKMNVSDHAEKSRILPPGTPRPGPLDLSYTPYLIEPMNNMSADSPIQETAVIKGAQLGFTMMAECVICYNIGEDPSDQLFISASAATIEKWASRRLEPAITSYGYRKMIQGTVDENRSGKRTGDKQFSKEYLGRRLDMASAQSASSMRSTDKKVLIRDEIDGAPPKLKTGEGNWLDVSFARTNAWGNRRKVMDFSTPTTFEKSLIWKRYIEGDRRLFFVPCPHCDGMQDLKMKNLMEEREDGVIVDAFYACEYCGEAIYEYDKTELFNPEKCEWKPTAKSSSKYMRSYSINSLYSPMGMLSWAEIAKKREQAYTSIDPEDKRSFINLYEGLPYKEEGRKPTIEKVIKLRGTYPAGEVPDRVLFITIGIDVQRGSAKDKANPARLEMEILGHGPGHRTFSIEYKKFIGKVDDPFSGAWEDLNQWAMDTEMIYRKKDGTEMQPSMTFIDSGDGTLTNVVYRFTGRWQNTYPIKGYQNLNKNSGIDRKSATDYKRYKRSRISGDTTLYNISTNFYKNMIYNCFNIERVEGELQAPGFSDFPISYDKKYFNMLTAEEIRNDGNFYCPDGKRNEALDIRCYALCAADVYLDLLTEQAREALKQKGGSEADAKKITRKWIIQSMKQRLNVTD